MLTAAEHRRVVSELSFALTVPRNRVSFRFAGPQFEITGHEQLHAPIVDLLQHKIASFDELLALPAYGEDKIALLLDCLALLIYSGQVLPVTTPADPAPAQRFNRCIVDSARSGRFFFHLASPVARTGFPVNDVALLAMAALFDGQEEYRGAAQHALRTLKGAGRRLVRDGKLIEDDDDATAFLAENMKLVMDEFVPIWRRLGVIEN
jgi:hypothetical protein